MKDHERSADAAQGRMPQLELVRDGDAAAAKLEELRQQLEARIERLEISLQLLDDRRREMDTLFESLKRSVQQAQQEEPATRFADLEAQQAELRATVEALRSDVTEAVAYLGVTANQRLTTLKQSVDHLKVRTTALEGHATFIMDRFQHYREFWPVRLVRRVRRKLRRS